MWYFDLDPGAQAHMPSSSLPSPLLLSTRTHSLTHSSLHLTTIPFLLSLSFLV